MFPPIWNHLQVHQECPCPPGLQEETWRTGGVLSLFLMSDLDETFTDTYDECSLPVDTIFRSIRYVHDVLDSRKRLGGQVESWHGSRCPIMIKLSQTLMMNDPSHLSPCPIMIKLSQTLMMNVPSHLSPLSIRNANVLQRFGGQVEYWHGSWCQNLTKHSQTLLMDAPCTLQSDTISRYIRNINVLLECRKRHGGQEMS